MTRPRRGGSSRRRWIIAASLITLVLLAIVALPPLSGNAFRALADANAELVRLNKAKSDFVSAVSHELRTPLAAIKGYAALLGSGQFGTLAGVLCGDSHSGGSRGYAAAC